MIEIPDTRHCGTHREAVSYLVTAMGWTRFAELGLARGHLAGRLLREHPDLRLIGVDLMQRIDRANALRKLARQYERRFWLMRGHTVAAADYVADGSLDAVFVDAGHSRAAVSADIAAWAPKIRPDGWLLGHDYGHRRYPGIAEVVDKRFGHATRLVGHTIWAVPGEAMGDGHGGG